jgi:hypothetical protein
VLQSRQQLTVLGQIFRTDTTPPVPERKEGSPKVSTSQLIRNRSGHPVRGIRPSFSSNLLQQSTSLNPNNAQETCNTTSQQPHLIEVTSPLLQRAAAVERSSIVNLARARYTDLVPSPGEWIVRNAYMYISLPSMVVPRFSQAEPTPYTAADFFRGSIKPQLSTVNDTTINELHAVRGRRAITRVHLKPCCLQGDVARRTSNISVGPLALRVPMLSGSCHPHSLHRGVAPV